MPTRLNTFIAALIACIIPASFAEDNSSPVLTKETVGKIAESIRESLQKFECKYSYSSKILPGYSEWLKVVSAPDKTPATPDQNKDGYNEVYHISYKRSGNAFYLKSENRFDLSANDTVRYHSDGTLFWENRDGNNRVNILSHAPALPLLYDNLLKNLPADFSQYSNALIGKSSLEEQLSEPNNRIEVSPNTNGTIDIRIIQPNNAHPIRGMKRLHRLSIELKSGFKITRYAYGAIYQHNSVEDIFPPLFDIEFSDFRSVETGTPKLPAKIKITERGIKSNIIPKNYEELVKLKKKWVPLKEHTLEVEDFNLNPTFNDGEINFSYPNGTQIIDMFGNRVYFSGDTLENLREKIKTQKGE